MTAVRAGFFVASAAALVTLAVWALAAAAGFEVRSPGFTSGTEIPARHTCDGEDVSPPLTWTAPPANTKSFALIADDPDAPGGTWVHWVLYGIPATARDLPQAMPTRETVAGIGVQGANDFRRIGYGGPCPPPGRAHRYVFKLYALDADLGLAPGRMKADLVKAMEGHVLATTELIGRYRRR